METSIDSLLPLYAREHEAGRAVALAVVRDTRGSTYRKAGALLLIAQNGDYAGLLTGGCLEADLLEHAAQEQRAILHAAPVIGIVDGDRLLAAGPRERREVERRRRHRRRPERENGCFSGAARGLRTGRARPRDDGDP